VAIAGGFTDESRAGILSSTPVGSPPTGWQVTGTGADNVIAYVVCIPGAAS
jgi:hypothetical protein